MLFGLIAAPLAVALLVSLAPAARARQIAMVGMLIPLAGVVFALYAFDWSGAENFQFDQRVEWLPRLGLTLSVGVDSVSLLMIALTALLGPICVAASTTAITERERTYYAWLLILQGAMTGVFAARDLIVFYTCFEFTLIPMYVLISLYGSTNRRKAAIKFFMYTFTGSVIALAGLAFVAWRHATGGADGAGGGTAWTFDIATLEATAQGLSRREQAWVLLALMAGFAVKVPLFPLHTWLPLAHTEAPTAGSVLLAGVLLKLGTYGLYRFALPFAPVAALEYAPLIGVLSVVGILYAGLICWVQTDVKKLVAYSSVSHLGVCVLGLFAVNAAGVSGSILYMINHGLSTGALFLCIGMMYERYHTRSMKELGGLAKVMPVWATFMVFFTMASVGLPGLNGFVSEFLCLLGAFQASSAWGSGAWGSMGGMTGGQVPGATMGNLGPWFAAIAGIGMIVAAIYLLYMVGRVVFGPLAEPGGHRHGYHAGHGAEDAHPSPLPRDLNLREVGTLLPLAIACVALGVYPKPLLDAIEAPVARTVRMVQASREPDLLGAGSEIVPVVDGRDADRRGAGVEGIEIDPGAPAPADSPDAERGGDGR